MKLLRESPEAPVYDPIKMRKWTKDSMVAMQHSKLLLPRTNYSLGISIYIWQMVRLK